MAHQNHIDEMNAVEGMFYVRSAKTIPELLQINGIFPALGKFTMYGQKRVLRRIWRYARGNPDRTLDTLDQEVRRAIRELPGSLLDAYSAPLEEHDRYLDCEVIIGETMPAIHLAAVAIIKRETMAGKLQLLYEVDASEADQIIEEQDRTTRAIVNADIRLPPVANYPPLASSHIQDQVSFSYVRPDAQLGDHQVPVGHRLLPREGTSGRIIFDRWLITLDNHNPNAMVTNHPPAAQPVAEIPANPPATHQVNDQPAPPDEVVVPSPTDHGSNAPEIIPIDIWNNAGGLSPTTIWQTIIGDLVPPPFTQQNNCTGTSNVEPMVTNDSPSHSSGPIIIDLTLDDPN